MKLGLFIVLLAAIGTVAPLTGASHLKVGTTDCKAVSPITLTCDGESYTPDGTATFNATSVVMDGWLNYNVTVRPRIGFTPVQNIPIYSGTAVYFCDATPTSVNPLTGSTGIFACDVDFTGVVGGAYLVTTNLTLDPAATVSRGVWGFKWNYPCFPLETCT